MENAIQIHNTEEGCQIEVYATETSATDNARQRVDELIYMRFNS